MDWQEIVCLTLVGLTASAFVWKKFRPRRFSFERDTHCGCGSPSQSAPNGSIVFRARRGEVPRVIVKMK